MENPAEGILQVSLLYAVPRCLHVLAELGIADHLGDDPRTAADLAAIAGVDAGALARALRLLSAYGIFERRDDAYVHTPASRLLREDHPQSMRSWVLWCGTSINWQGVDLLGHSIRTGQPSAEQVISGGVWAYLKQNPDIARIFDRAMTDKAHDQIAGILAGYDFSQFRSIADIGGGRGHLLQAVLAAAPEASGVLFDLPHVVEHVRSAPPRFKVQGGDFFKDLLPACDAYLVMQVIHDWDDQRSVEILSAIRRAAPAHARLMLIEAIVPEDSNPSWIKLLDVYMMLVTGGKERTRSDFGALLAGSGFRLERTIDVGLGTSILEASVI